MVLFDKESQRIFFLIKKLLIHYLYFIFHFKEKNNKLSEAQKFPLKTL